MSEAKFTKGEWKINEAYETMLMIDNESNHSVACVECGCGVDECGTVIRPNQEEISNAHLIACAPEMYEMLSFLEQNPSELNCIHIRKLLAKARGEKQ